MKKLLTPKQEPKALALMNDIMQQAGQAANEAGARHIFETLPSRRDLWHKSSKGTVKLSGQLSETSATWTI